LRELLIQKISPVRLAILTLCATTLLLLAACGGGQSSQGSSDASQGGTTAVGQSAGQKYPDVREAELESSGGDTWTLSVTVSSPYDSPERYADGWRVLSPNGDVLGKHELMHDHAGEQPFTRSQTGLEIPQDVEKITVEARDLKNGYGGETVTIQVPRG
jgi:hypothetical protein